MNEVEKVKKISMYNIRILNILPYCDNKASWLKFGDNIVHHSSFLCQTDSRTGAALVRLGRVWSVGENTASLLQNIRQCLCSDVLDRNCSSADV